MDFGYKPPIPLAAVLQGAADQDARYAEDQKRMMDKQKLQSTLEDMQSQIEARKYSSMYNKALTDQIYHNMESSQDKLAKQRAQADQIKAQQSYPLISGLAAAAKRAISSGDMNSLYAIADQYERVKDKLPEAFQFSGQPNEYAIRDQSGKPQRSVMSSFDPQQFIDMAAGADRARGVAQIETQDLKNTGAQQRQETSIQGQKDIAQIQADAKKYAADAMLKAKQIAAANPKVNANQAATALIMNSPLSPDEKVAALQEVMAASALAAPGQQQPTYDPVSKTLSTPAAMRGKTAPQVKLPDGWSISPQ